MAEPYKHIYRVDLNQPLKRFDVGDILASGDEKANSFEVAVCRDGVNVDLAGCAVYGYFIRPNDETMKVNGTASGNVARVELSKSCYVYDGAFSFAIKVTGNGITQTVAVFDGRIVRTTSENIVDGDRAFYGLEDLLAQIAAVEAATNYANTAATNANNSATRANQAASAIENATASAQTLATGKQATVSVDGMHFTFGLPRGEKGEKGDPGTIENVTITSIAGLSEALEGKQPKGDYLAAGGTAVNAEKLGGNAPSYYLPAAGTATDSSKIGGKTWASRLLEVYPVGCIYISENATSPASLFGGTWTRITDRFLLGCQSTTYPAGSTGGEATHTLTVAEMPSHFHQFQGYWRTDNTGEHTVTSYEIVHGDQESVDSACKRSGGDQPHNNMPPYLAVYMWKRVS